MLNVLCASARSLKKHHGVIGRKQMLSGIMPLHQIASICLAP